MLAYLVAHNNGKENYEYEMAYIMAFMVDVTAKNIVIINRVFSKFTPDQMTDARKNGMKMIKSGTTQMMDGLITSIGESAYSSKSVLRMAKALDDNIKIFSGYYTENAKKANSIRLLNLANSQKNEDVKRYLLSALKKYKRLNKLLHADLVKLSPFSLAQKSRQLHQTGEQGIRR